MTLCLHPSYFPNIHTFALLTQYEVVWEVHDNFQKQTYRNRCYISTDTGTLMLSIPVKHSRGGGRQLYRDVQIDNTYHWQRDHWRSLMTAYRSSPFFEYFEDDLAPLFHKPFKNLLELNMETISTMARLIQLPVLQNTTEAYKESFDKIIDGRPLVDAKLHYPNSIPPYMQVFEDRNGFLPDLSILDLLFNEGNASLDYLRKLGASISLDQ